MKGMSYNGRTEKRNRSKKEEQQNHPRVVPLQFAIVLHESEV
jgi:hypothetical protein